MKNHYHKILLDLLKHKNSSGNQFNSLNNQFIYYRNIKNSAVYLYIFKNKNTKFISINEIHFGLNKIHNSIKFSKFFNKTVYKYIQIKIFIIDVNFIKTQVEETVEMDFFLPSLN